MKIFDYIYYRIYSFYKYKWKETMPNLYSIGAISVLQMINFTNILFLCLLLFYPNHGIKKFYGGIVVVIGLLYNYYRYEHITNFYTLEKKWNSENETIKAYKGLLILLYIIATFSFFLLTVHYSSSIKEFGKLIR